VGVHGRGVAVDAVDPVAPVDPAEEVLDAGDLGTWLLEVRAAVRGERDAVVPCNGCTACCTSSQFVHIGPDETETLARIPPELLFPAPRMPPGHVLLGYDEDGCCPMLVDGRCSIYEHRPRTCRTYDCRIFPAAGIAVEDDDKVLIARRAERWRFRYAADADRTRHEAVQAAATYLREHGERTGAGPAVVASPTRLALLAIQVHETFLGRDGESDGPVIVDPDPDAVRRAVQGPRQTAGVDGARPEAAARSDGTRRRRPLRGLPAAGS
jgi:Fe-S-cluster containining protein